MKRLALGFGLRFGLCFGLCLLFPLFNPALQGQDRKTVGDDASAVRATVLDYIEAYYAGDARRLQQTLHPHYLKHVIEGSLPIGEKTAAQILEDVRTQGRSALPETDQTEDISVLDISGDLACAKLVTPRWVDYLTLWKSDGRWQILSVVQHMDN
jgi:hypothetical protein